LVRKFIPTVASGEKNGNYTYCYYLGPIDCVSMVVWRIEKKTSPGVLPPAVSPTWLHATDRRTNVRVNL